MSSAENMAASSVSSRRPLDDASREWLRCLAGRLAEFRAAGLVTRKVVDGCTDFPDRHCQPGCRRVATYSNTLTS
jgi:hypothetical protein